MTSKTKTPTRVPTRQSSKPRIFAEIADFLAKLPSRDQVLDFHPSAKIQRRASTLLRKNREDTLTDEDRAELEEFSQAEAFMRLLKAKCREAKAL